MPTLLSSDAAVLEPQEPLPPGKFGSRLEVHRAIASDLIVEFAGEVFESMVRTDQRRWGEVYLRALMLDGRRKSVEPMTARLEDGDEQCLQQFVNQSPWRWEPVRRNLAMRMTAEIAPDVWVIDDTGFPKFGDKSVGVARQYCGALGKIDWRLFLPEEWDDDPRRQACRVPDDVGHEPKWKLALSMIDELTAWGIAPEPVLGDAYGDITAFRLGLEERGIAYVLDVKGATSALPAGAELARPAYKGNGRPLAPRYRRPFSALAAAGGQGAYQPVTWPRGDPRADDLTLPRHPRQAGQRQAQACRPRRRASRSLAAGRMARRQGRPDRLLAVQPARRHDHRSARRAGQAQVARRAGLPRAQRRAPPGHFEGRSWPGWHYHVTLVSVAHGFLTSERLRRPASAGGRLISLFEIVGELQTLLACWQGTCPTCRRRLPPDTAYPRGPP